MSRWPEGVQCPLALVPFVPAAGSSLPLVAPVCSPRFGSPLPLRSSGVASSAAGSVVRPACGLAAGCWPRAGLGWVSGCAAQGRQFRHLHQGDRARVVSC